MSSALSTETVTAVMKDQQVLLDYMVDKLPEMESVRSSLDPIYTQIMNNPCTSDIDWSIYHKDFTALYPKDCTTFDMSSVPKDWIMPYYGTSFQEGSADGSSYNNSIDLSYVSDEQTRSSGLRFGLVEVREYNRTVGDHPGKCTVVVVANRCS